MSATVEVLSSVTLSFPSNDSWTSAAWQAVECSGYSEASVIAEILQVELGSGGNVEIVLQTALERRDDAFVDLISLSGGTVSPSTLPARYYRYLKGAGEGMGLANPGFGAYLRTRVSATVGTGSVSITARVTALLKQ